MLGGRHCLALQVGEARCFHLHCSTWAYSVVILAHPGSQFCLLACILYLCAKQSLNLVLLQIVLASCPLVLRGVWRTVKTLTTSWLPSAPRLMKKSLPYKQDKQLFKQK